MTEPNATIIMYDDYDKCDSNILHVPMPKSQDEVWMYVLRKGLDMPDLRLEDVQRTKDDLGDDLLDFTIVAVIPGIHNCVYSMLSVDFIA